MISSSSSFNPDCNAIMKGALQTAGLLPLGRQPNPNEMADARWFLDTFLKAPRRAALTQMERATIPLLPGVASYVLPADTIEVSEPTTITLAGQTSETWLKHSVWKEYQELSNKTQQGTPVIVYVEKQAQVSLVFWPVPDNTYTLNYQRQRLVRDAGAGNTVDLTQRWIRAMTFQMAADMALAASLDIGRVSYLQKMADKYIGEAEEFESEGGGMMLCLPSLR